MGTGDVEVVELYEGLSPNARVVAEEIIYHAATCQYPEQLQAFALPLLEALESSSQRLEQ